MRPTGEDCPAAVEGHGGRPRAVAVGGHVHKGGSDQAQHDPGAHAQEVGGPVI